MSDVLTPRQAYARAWYARRRSLILQQKREYYALHRDAVLARHLAARAANPEKVREQNRRASARYRETHDMTENLAKKMRNAYAASLVAHGGEVRHG